MSFNNRFHSFDNSQPISSCSTALETNKKQSHVKTGSSRVFFFLGFSSTLSLRRGLGHYSAFLPCTQTGFLREDTRSCFDVFVFSRTHKNVARRGQEGGVEGGGGAGGTRVRLYYM